MKTKKDISQDEKKNKLVFEHKVNKDQQSSAIGDIQTHNREKLWKIK